MAARKNLALLFPNKTDDNQDYIVTDEVKLIQILENLLNNAIKFTHAGCIELKYIIVDNSIKILVKDTGIGIHNESTEIIFERFRQADPSISVNYGGTGLGLSISKSYAQMLNGTLQVESQPGIGSEFMLTLPYISNNSIIEKEECTRKTLIAKSLKILVAEDEITNYHLLKDFLQSNNTTLYYAQNGFEAVKSVKDNPQIDLVLMDIKMPVMDGITALKKIKKIRKQLPVIALTAYAMMQDGQKFLNLGFDDYIPKPIHRDNLIEKINNLISIP
jgi:CheY-like chemotaxis protein/anti-sigma regulatory factor (Ser/Thr protein kinase)